MKHSIVPSIAAAVFIWLLSSCATVPETGSNSDYLQPETPGKPKTPVQLRLVESAEYYKGTKSGDLKAGSRTYSLDCSGAILAIYYKAGIDLEKCYVKYSGNGVKRLYSCVRDNKLILNTKTPMPGDLIFWDNTWDRNEDGKFNDYFTHVGMVVGVKPGGTISYIHHNYRRGLVYETMNLNRPDDPKLNSAMRMRGSPPAPNGQSLASHLVRVFGRAWKLPREYFRK